jgi:hypothetical protein
MNMLQVIQRGAATSARRDQDLPCPFCGTDPPLATRIAGRFIVACQNEDCAAGPQVASDTLQDAWTRWNRRAG